jgi:hypothetical protein
MEGWMQFLIAVDPEAAALRGELAALATSTDQPGIMTANVWLWQIESLGQDLNPRELTAALFKHSSAPGQKLLLQHPESAPWVELSPTAAQEAALQLLCSGTSLEIAVFDGDLRTAMKFVDRLFTWVGSPLKAFTNLEHRKDGVVAGFSVFQLIHWVDEGLVLLGPNRIGLLWFLGTD